MLSDLIEGEEHLVGAGILATSLLGDPRATLAGRPRLDHVAWGIAGACGTLAISLLYALVLGLRLDWEWQAPAPTVVLGLAVLPAVVEEWLCRGVLWAACRRLTTTGSTIVITAVLFGLMHVLAWGPFGFPSRALGGLVLGLLRARTNSLVPCLLAHLLNNTAAACIES